VLSENPIYTVTSLDTRSISGLDCRCFGFFHALEDAEKAVKENCSNIQESKYDVVLIEKQLPGIHTTAQIILFYKWSAENEEWMVQTDIPTDFCYYITNYNGIG
jgi:hypothetical protein